MNLLLGAMIVLIFLGIFFGAFFLIKLVFTSIEGGIELSAGDVLTSPPNDLSGYLSFIISGMITVIIIILSAAWMIKRRAR